MDKILVVGAGPAGMAAAIRARQFGLQVQVIDRVDEEYEKVCGDGLTEQAVKELCVLGFSRETLFAAGANVIHESMRLYPSGRREILDHKDMTYFCMRRILLMKLMRSRALSIGVDICFRTEFHPDMKADVIVDASGCHNRARYGVRLPVGMSSVIYADADPDLRTDTLYFVYPEEDGRGYCWAFPLPDGMWNVGAWDPMDPKRLRHWFDNFTDRYLNRYFHSVRTVRPLRGACLGTVKPGVPLCSEAVSCGDAAGLCDPCSGEGISYALRSGIEAADSICLKYTDVKK